MSRDQIKTAVFVGLGYALGSFFWPSDTPLVQRIPIALASFLIIIVGSIFLYWLITRFKP